MTFTVAKNEWEAPENRLSSRHISVEKHEALNQMIDGLLYLKVIQLSRATAWSQAHLVRKPTNGWRFTVDFRNLNKVISNEGWQIPNMKEMIERIGSVRPARFAIADLTSGFFQMPLDEPCRQYTAFITFRGIYEWTRVPMGLLPSANFFQKSMGVHVLHGLIYNICEVYIDDMLIFGTNEDNFLTNTRTVCQRCRERNVTLNAKKLIIGFDTIPFVGHDIDAKGINMSQNELRVRIECKPTSQKELQLFMGVVIYFKDHLRRDHSVVAIPL